MCERRARVLLSNCVFPASIETIHVERVYSGVKSARPAIFSRHRLGKDGKNDRDSVSRRSIAHFPSYYWYSGVGFLIGKTFFDSFLDMDRTEDVRLSPHAYPMVPATFYNNHLPARLPAKEELHLSLCLKRCSAHTCSQQPCVVF